MSEAMSQVILDRAGFYLFGGLDSNGKASDDLFLVQFNTEVNAVSMETETGEYKNGSVAACEMVAEKIISHGRGPCARSQHAS